MAIEKILAESASTEKRQAPPEAWPFIAEALHPKKKGRGLWIFFFGITTISIGLFLYIQFSKNSIKQKETTFLSSAVPNNDLPITTVHKIINNSSNIAHIEQSNIQQLKIEQQQLNTATKVIANKKISSSNEIKILKTVSIQKVNKQEKPQPKEEENEMKAINARALEDTAIVLNEELVIDSSILRSTDSAIKPNVVSSKDSNISKQIAITKNKKWHYLVQASYGAFYINKNNPIGTSSDGSKSIVNSFSAGTSIRSSANYPSNYKTGTSFTIGLLAEKEQPKKVNIQLGFCATYNQYAALVFKATNANIGVSNNFLQTDSTASFGNSNYATSPTTADVGGYKIKSKNLSLSVIIGAKVQLAKLSKYSSVKLQTQLIPSIFIAKSNLWFNVENGRYFTNKKVDANFQLGQSISCLWHINTKQQQFAVGPTYQFGWLKNNKTIMNLQNVHTSSFGMQVQYFLKK